MVTLDLSNTLPPLWVTWIRWYTCATSGGMPRNGWHFYYVCVCDVAKLTDQANGVQLPRHTRHDLPFFKRQPDPSLRPCLHDPRGRILDLRCQQEAPFVSSLSQLGSALPAPMSVFAQHALRNAQRPRLWERVISAVIACACGYQHFAQNVDRVAF